MTSLSGCLKGNRSSSMSGPFRQTWPSSQVRDTNTRRGSCRPVTMWPSSVITSQCLQSKTNRAVSSPQLNHSTSPRFKSSVQTKSKPAHWALTDLKQSYGTDDVATVSPWWQQCRNPRFTSSENMFLHQGWGHVQVLMTLTRWMKNSTKHFCSLLFLEAIFLPETYKI